jgi:hypothetical protein
LNKILKNTGYIYIIKGILYKFREYNYIFWKMGDGTVNYFILTGASKGIGESQKSCRKSTNL